MHRIPTIPGYELYQPLGGGPITVVHAARELETEEPCAVKCIREEWEDQPTAIKLLQREARAGLKAQHPYLVPIWEAQVMTPPWYLVMPLLSGESLRRRLQRDYRLDLIDALWISRQIAEALAELHRHGFLHGDVKPENVHLVEQGEAVLIDLGFAHRPGENAAFLQQGYVLGTPDYLAPELCLSCPTADLSSDLFSLGVMLFEMLTGTLPWPPGSVNETFRRHGCDPPDDIRRFPLRLPAGLIRLVERLLSRRPEQRPRVEMVVQQLILLEINTLGRRHAA